MTQIQLDGPMDEQAFEDGLAELLEVANRDGVPIERAWECYVDDDSGWEVEIVPLSSKTKN